MNTYKYIINKQPRFNRTHHSTHAASTCRTQKREWGWPQHSGAPCRLAAGRVHVRDLTSFHSSVFLLIQSQTSTAISSHLSTALAFPSPACFISLPTLNYFEYYDRRKKIPVADGEISLFTEKMNWRNRSDFHILPWFRL